jgi:hypothetical protein
MLIHITEGVGLIKESRQVASVAGIISKILRGLLITEREGQYKSGAL